MCIRRSLVLLGGLISSPSSHHVERQIPQEPRTKRQAPRTKYSMSDKSLSPIERIKKDSHALRGTIVQGLNDEITGAIHEDDQAVVKFHGMYQQDDRDVREERAEKKLERLYSFMIRLRLPGGFLTPQQWIATHEIAGKNTTGVIKITSRQTIQLHGLIKSKIKPTIADFNTSQLDSIATC